MVRKGGVDLGEWMIYARRRFGVVQIAEPSKKAKITLFKPRYLHGC
jgi:hypothetical protein